MKYVYDYMFHLLSEYAKVLKYKPYVPKESMEVCSEMLICSTMKTTKELLLWKFMKQTEVKGGAEDSSPCSLQPPFDKKTLQNLLVRKANLTNKVQSLEERV